MFTQETSQIHHLLFPVHVPGTIWKLNCGIKKATVKALQNQDSMRKWLHLVLCSSKCYMLYTGKDGLHIIYVDQVGGLYCSHLLLP